MYDVINVLESINLIERPLSVKRGVQWKGPPLTDVALPPGCPRVEPTRFKDLLRKQSIRKRAAAELLAVNNNKKFRADHGVRRSARAARGAVFARLEDPMRRSLHHAIEEIEAQLSWQPPTVYTLVWQLYGRLGRYAHPLKFQDGCETLLGMHAHIQNANASTRWKMTESAERTRKMMNGGEVAEAEMLSVLQELSALLRADLSVRPGGAPPGDGGVAIGGLPPMWAKGEEIVDKCFFEESPAAPSAIIESKMTMSASTGRQ